MTEAKHPEAVKRAVVELKRQSNGDFLGAPWFDDDFLDDDGTVVIDGWVNLLDLVDAIIGE